MEALRTSSFFHFPLTTISTRLPCTKFEKTHLNLPPTQRPNLVLSSSIHTTTKSKSKLFTAKSPTVSTEPTDPPQKQTEMQNPEEKFDWYAHWYPVMPVCDLDKRKPNGKRVMGLDIVVWWDRNESEWKVFDDSCPHRLAPLSEGRIDQWGRLQCVYHGWCFGGSGDCKFIPQALRDGPPVHTFKKACVAVYPSCVQNDIVWFWPNTDPQYKDILMKKKPPYIPEIDDPSFTKSMMNREFPYGYEVLLENLMDPAHVAYAHYGIMSAGKTPKSMKADREGGIPLNITIRKADINGFTSEKVFGITTFIAPCISYGFLTPMSDPGNGSASSAETVKRPSSLVPQRRSLLVFFCIPVSPGNSRLIVTAPRNFGVWIDRVVPRWMFHLGQNLILDSDLYLLHVEERKLRDAGPSNWQKACFVPTKSDAPVVSFRRWLNKYAGGQPDWGTKFSEALPPTPHREQLMDRYWSHVVNCNSCSLAYKGLNALEITLKVISIVSIAVVASVNHGMSSAAARNTLVAMAVLCFVASKWLSHFVYKNFHFHDYNHAFV